jgi:hypothetical protein
MDEYVLRPIGRVESLLSTGAPPRVSRWRTPKYQEQLLDEATSKYGSAEEAARWGGHAQRAAHVSGDAVT